MPGFDQPRPVLRLQGVLRGEVDSYQSRPDRDGVVRTLGRCTVLTDEGGFLNVSVPEDLLAAVSKGGPEKVDWLVEVSARREQLMTGSGADRKPWVSPQTGQPSYSATLSVWLLRVVEPQPVLAEVPARKTA